MKVKKILMSILALMLVFSTLAACTGGTKDPEGSEEPSTTGDASTEESSGEKPETTELNIFTWDGYYPEDILNEFEDATGITINFSAFTSNEEMLTKLQAAKGGDYDIILASDYIISLAVKEGGLVGKLDKELIPNFENLDPAFLGQYYDENDEYTIPYAPGTPLIVYDKTLTDLKIEGYEDLWDESLKDNIVLLDTPRVLMGITFLTMGESMNTTDFAKIEEAGKKLTDLAPNIRALDGANPQSLMNGEVAVGFMFTSQVAEAMMLNQDLELVYPKEGKGFGIDAMFVPENAPNWANAHKFINYILEPEIGARVSEQILYLCPNKASVEFLSEDFKNNKALHIPADILGDAEFILDLEPDVLEKYNIVWTEFVQSMS